MLLCGTSTVPSQSYYLLGLYMFLGVVILIPEVNSEDHAPLVHLHKVKTSGVLPMSQMARQEARQSLCFSYCLTYLRVVLTNMLTNCFTRTY